MTDGTDLIDAGKLTKDEKNWGMYCHLASLLGFVLPVLGNFGGPLLVWILKKDEYPLVADQGKEVLNFQITLLLLAILGSLLTAVFIGILLLWVLPFYFFILAVIAAIKTSNGEAYRYPFTLRLIN